MSKTVTFANFKGGVGKTTASVMFSYLLNKRGKKVLLIDLDPQHHATDIIFKTYGIETKEYNSVFDGIQKKDLSESIYEMDDNLHLIPSDIDLVGFTRYLYSVTRDINKQPFFLDSLLRDIRGNYDYVFIDVPPTISELTNNAIVASDSVVLIMQTHHQSYTSAIEFIDYLRDMQNYNSDIDLLGVIAYMMDAKGKVDNEIVDDAREIFGDILFKNRILTRQRIKRFGRNGIKNEDAHDEKVLTMFEEVINEFAERV